MATTSIPGRQPLDLQRHGPTGTAPPDPVILPDLALVVSSSTRWRPRWPVNAPWTGGERRQLGRPDPRRASSKPHSVTPQFRELIPAATRPIFGAEPRELSLLFTLFYIAASGNEQNAGTFERNFNTRMGAQQ